jgi:hypothetical protein
MRVKIMTMLSGTAAVLGIALSSAAIAQQPASPAQLSVWESEKAALQAQQQTDRNERERLRVALENLPAKIRALVAEENLYATAQTNPGVVVGQAWAQGKNPGQVAGEALTRNIDVRNKLNTARALQIAVPMRIAELDAAIEQRERQIAQLNRTIAYYRNPAKGDLENERARLKNLEAQKPTQDDGGQLGWDIDNTNRRITELDALQKQFQQPGGSPGGASSGQSQGAYGAPATGSQSQLPPGYDSLGGPAMGYTTVPGSPMPNYQDLQRDFPPQPSQKGGSKDHKHKHSGSKGGCDC